MDKINPSKRRSKEWITESFMMLLEKYTFEEITIKEITDNADLVRQTFYRDFDSKEDILKQYIAGFMHDAFDKIIIEDIHDTREMGRIWFTFLSQHKDILRILYRNNILELFTDISSDMIHELNSKIKGNLMIDYDEDAIKYYNCFNVTGFLSMVETWIENDFKESVERLGELYEIILTDNPHIRYKLKNN